MLLILLPDCVLVVFVLKRWLKEFQSFDIGIVLRLTVWLEQQNSKTETRFVDTHSGRILLEAFQVSGFKVIYRFMLMRMFVQP